MGSLRYPMTQPKTINGETAYFKFLEDIFYGEIYTGTRVRDSLGQYMTFQALRENKLVTYDKYYRITEKGRLYISYVNSTNKPNKQVIKTILDS